MDYTIKNMCQKLDLSVHTVRHYCDMGLVPNLRHDKNGNRILTTNLSTGCRALNSCVPADFPSRRSVTILPCARKEVTPSRNERTF